MLNASTQIDERGLSNKFAAPEWRTSVECVAENDVGAETVTELSYAVLLRKLRKNYVVTATNCGRGHCGQPIRFEIG
mgnify:CR=1 FL=1|jgi:hypothetical protein